MSILTLSKDETFNNYMPNTRLNEIKAASDIKNDTDDLTITRDRRDSSHGQAARIVRNKNDDKELLAISADVDSLDYFDQLLKGEC